MGAHLDDRLLHPQVVEADAHGGGLAHRLPVGALEALPRRAADLLKERKVPVEAGEDRLRDLLGEGLHHFVARMEGYGRLS